MIERKTVFILGAGSNCSYGFPSGWSLKKDIIETINQSLSEDAKHTFHTMAYLGAAEIDEVQDSRCRDFVNALEKSGQASIDAFLDANRHIMGFDKIGKGAIAQVLLEREKTSFTSDYHTDDDWLEYLFQIMYEGTRSPQEFIERNKVSFVTFNYDRFLEYWFFTRLKYSFCLDDNEAFEYLRQISIHHIYGDLGPIPPFFNSDRHGWIESAKNIRTIFDTEHDPKAINSSQGLIITAKTIYLLGFGFHSENIKLLDLIELTAESQKKAVKFYAQDMN